MGVNLNVTFKYLELNGDLMVDKRGGVMMARIAQYLYILVSVVYLDG